MKVFLLLIVLSSLALYFFFFKSSKARKKSRKNRLDIAKWMDMTPDQRNEFDEGEKKSTFQRKRRLLDQIRKEYAALDTKEK